MRREFMPDGTTDDLFYHCDDMHTIYPLTDEAGQVQEHYEYGDYGLPTILGPSRKSEPITLQVYSCCDKLYF